MNNYDIYFEIYGKKLKTTVTADSEAEAKRKVVSKIKFNKVSLIPEQDDTVEFLKGMFGMK